MFNFYIKNNQSINRLLFFFLEIEPTTGFRISNGVVLNKPHGQTNSHSDLGSVEGYCPDHQQAFVYGRNSRGC